MTDFRRFQELAEIAVSCLNESSVDYVLVGGATIGVYGAIRSTEDLDFMIMLERSEEQKIAALVDCFQKNNLSITKKELIQGLEEHSHITVFDMKSPLLRLDLKQIRTKLDYSTYNLRKKVDLFGSGIDFWISSAESLIIVKLLPGFQSEKDIEDVKGILLRSSESLDWFILKELSQIYDVDKLLEKIRNEI